jgi:predicted amidohydrolase YtcJ
VAAVMSHQPRALPLVDLLLTNGRIMTFGDADQAPAEVQAVAMAAGRIIAVGSDQELAHYGESATQVIDLQGARVLPGLNDSHIHAVRGGVSWLRIVHWEDIRSLEEGFAKLREDAKNRPAGEWISVVGGWHQSQLAENRPPTRAELDQVCSDNPVYIQELYDRGILNSQGLAACGWDDESENPVRGELVRDDTGRLSGEIHGVGAFSIPLAKVLQMSDDNAAHGTREMFSVFAEHGLTGIVDGGGLLVSPRDYDPIYDLWRSGDLNLRVRMFISAWDRGGEVGNIDSLTSLVQAESGDDMLRVAGVGEIPHLGCHDMEGLDPFTLSDEAFLELVEIVRICVKRQWRMSVHAVLNSTLSRILDAFEVVEAETSLLHERGFSIVHADEATPENLDRMAALGVGVMVQNRLILKGSDYVEHWGEDATASAPPIAQMRERDITIGGGTDATRANWFSPWASIWWLVTGETLNGEGVRAEAHRLSVDDAIRAYTRDAAWFTGEQDRRGRIVPGYDADICVPTNDPYTVDPRELRHIRSSLTVLNGQIVHHTL